MSTSKLSTPDTLLRESNSDGEFGDPNVTPEPLQISKRGSLRSSNPITLNSLNCFSRSQSPCRLTPTRISSALKNFTRLIPAQQDPNSPTTEWNPSDNPLYVHKQRWSNSSPPTYNVEYKVLVPSALVPTHAPARNQCIHTVIESGLGGTKEGPKVITAARSQPTRAFSTGNFEQINWPSPIIRNPWTSSAPPVTQPGPRRAVTTNDAPHRVSESGKNDRVHILRRQRPFKQRLMIRMMGGLPHRACDSNPGGNQRRQSMQLPQLDTNPFASRPCQDLSFVRQSISSRKDTCSGSELDSALSAFPTPPTSTYASPTSAASTRSSRIQSQRYRSLRKPEHLAIMGAKLTLTSEFDEIDSEDGKTMLIAIDVQGALHTTVNGQNLWSQHTGLDVVVVIDNSSYTSPSALMSSCETARFLASTLNVITDRMAIICISSLQDSDSTLIWPLSHVKEQKIKTSLDAITTTKQMPTADLWKQAISFAREILVYSPIPNEDAEPLQDTFGHIFVLTGNAVGLPSEMLTEDKLQFHIICLASVPSERHKSIKCNGWKLQSQSDNELRVLSAKNDPNPTGLLNRLRGLIMHARGGKFEGVLSDIVVDVKAGQGCSIEGVMGSSKRSVLHLGESFTILVKVKIHGVRAKGFSLSHAMTHPGHPIDANDIMGELDKMLGSSSVKILTARLNYKHSVLPEGTICSISADYCLKQQIPTPNRERSQPQPCATQPKECTTLVQKRLAYHIATHGSPRSALSNLRREFGEAGARSYCQDYIKLIMEELDFQIRIVDRLEFDASPKKPIKWPDSVIIDNLTGHFGKGPFNPENYEKPRDWLTDAMGEGVSGSGNKNLGIISELGRDTRSGRKTAAVADEARVLRGDLKEPPESPYLRHRAVNLRGGTDRKVRVRDLVLGSRITGSGISRSISLPAETTAPRVAASSR